MVLVEGQGPVHMSPGSNSSTGSTLISEQLEQEWVGMRVRGKPQLGGNVHLINNVYFCKGFLSPQSMDDISP